MKLPKKPKRPKMSASLDVWQKWDKRVIEWKKRCAAIKAGPAKKRAISNKHR